MRKRRNPIKTKKKDTSPFALPIPSNIILKAIARAIRHQMEIKGIQIATKVKLSLVSDEIILYI